MSQMNLHLKCHNDIMFISKCYKTIHLETILVLLSILSDDVSRNTAIRINNIVMNYLTIYSNRRMKVIAKNLYLVVFRGGGGA